MYCVRDGETATATAGGEAEARRRSEAAAGECGGGAGWPLRATGRKGRAADLYAQAGSRSARCERLDDRPPGRARASHDSQRVGDAADPGLRARAVPRGAHDRGQGSAKAAPKAWPAHGPSRVDGRSHPRRTHARQEPRGDCARTQRGRCQDLSWRPAVVAVDGAKHPHARRATARARLVGGPVRIRADEAGRERRSRARRRAAVAGTVA